MKSILVLRSAKNLEKECQISASLARFRLPTIELLPGPSSATDEPHSYS